MARLAQLGVFRNIVKLSAVEIGLGGQLVPLGIHEFATGFRLSLFKLSEPVLYSFELSFSRVLRLLLDLLVHLPHGP